MDPPRLAAVAHLHRIMLAFEVGYPSLEVEETVAARDTSVEVAFAIAKISSKRETPFAGEPLEEMMGDVLFTTLPLVGITSGAHTPAREPRHEYPLAEGWPHPPSGFQLPRSVLGFGWRAH